MFDCVAFALEVEFKEQQSVSSVIRLNPATYKLKNWHVFNYYLYVISEDEDKAKQLQKLQMSDDKYKHVVERPRPQR